MTFQDRFSDGPPDWDEPCKYADGRPIRAGDIVWHDGTEAVVTASDPVCVSLETPRGRAFVVRRADARGLRFVADARGSA